jgi:hypothetical protein
MPDYSDANKKAANLGKAFKDSDATERTKQAFSGAVKGAQDLAGKFFGNKPSSGSAKKTAPTAAKSGAAKKMASPAKLSMSKSKKKKKSS